MSKLDRKLSKWAEAGLISPEQHAEILAHEQARSRNRFGFGLVGVALFAILAGILSIIAAHWMAIPGPVKIGGHLLVNLLVAGALFQVWKADHHWVREGLLLLFFGLTLTLIALIGQVFQFDGSLANAFLLWLAITSPLMIWAGRSKMTALAWMVAFLVTVGTVFEEYVANLPDFWSLFFGLILAVVLPLGMAADGRLGLFRRLNPVLANMFIATGFLLLTIGATAASLFWYADIRSELGSLAEEAGLSFGQGMALLWAIAAVVAVGLAVNGALAAQAGAHRAVRIGFLYGGVSALFILLPWLLPTDGMKAAGMVSFLLYWVFVGWAGQAMDAPRLVTLAITLIALRIFIIYWEALGGLMQQGLGLITGGIVMLVLVWGARRLNRHILHADSRGAGDV